MPPSKDQIYAEPLNTIAGFVFDERVVSVFPDMIQRSVPGYSTIIAMTGVLAERYAQPHTQCYDLGCSLGASTLAMRAQLDNRDCGIVAVDNSAAMIERCRSLIASDTHTAPVALRLARYQFHPHRKCLGGGDEFHLTVHCAGAARSPADAHRQ